MIRGSEDRLDQISRRLPGQARCYVARRMPLGIDEAALQGDRNRMRAIARPNFAKNALNRVLDSVFRNAQVCPDNPV